MKQRQPVILKKILMTLAAVLLLSANNNAQQIIFPDVYGQDLLDSLVAEYKPVITLSYGGARDVMYALLDNQNDSLSCVYTDYTIYVPFNAPNPRSYTNGASPIINAEHTFPQSKGATGPARRDLHALYPTNEIANSARSSYPFDEIPDPATDRWYLGTNVINGTIPSTRIDEYSELDFSTRFEPREDHKGNVARSMFYFYTMYRHKADSADFGFFDMQKTVLRQWSNLDPVDSRELTRTNGIATYQSGKPNPFVLDTTLIGRAYFGVTTGIEGGKDGAAMPVVMVLKQNYPNPFNPETTIEYQLQESRTVNLTVYNARGQAVAELQNGRKAAGTHRIQWQATDRSGAALASGIYWIALKSGQQQQVRKALLIR